MKLVERSKQAGIEQEMLAKQQEQQLDQLREQATEQTKMQVTIAQQSKLIDYLQDKTPTSKPTSRIRQVYTYCIISVCIGGESEYFIRINFCNRVPPPSTFSFLSLPCNKSRFLKFHIIYCVGNLEEDT